MRAAILLACNCGFGNNDVGMLPLSAIDMTKRWANYPRPKTAIQRKCPLWPETVVALREAIAANPAPAGPEFAGLALLTRFGTPWAKETPDSPITKEFRKLQDHLRMHRPGLSSYTLRHVFETITGDCCDQIAVDAIMGHSSQSMSAVYRERISDDRLLAVSNCVRRWLFRRDSAKLWRAMK